MEITYASEHEAGFPSVVAAVSAAILVIAVVSARRASANAALSIAMQGRAKDAKIWSAHVFMLLQWAAELEEGFRRKSAFAMRHGGE